MAVHFWLLDSILNSAKNHIPLSIKKQLYHTKLWTRYVYSKRGTPVDRKDILAILDDLKTASAESYLRNTLGDQEPTSLRGLPKEIVIEINDTCNIDCAMCKTSLARRPKGLMDVQLFEKVVKQISALGLNVSSLHTIGDPLANRRLPEYLKVMRKHGVYLGFLSSNFLLIDKHIDTIFEYRDVILSIRPSIDAASRDTFEKIRCGGKWADFHAGLAEFAERNRESANPFPVFVHSIIAKDNFHEIAFIPHMFSFLAPPANFHFSFINSASPTNDYFFEQSYFDDKYILNTPCHLIWTGLHILKDGSLTACCRDYHGDLIFGAEGGDLEELYNNKAISRLRDISLRADVAALPAACQECFIVDPRYSAFINLLFNYFFGYVRKHPVYLQNTLNRIGPHLKSGNLQAVKAEIAAL